MSKFLIMAFMLVSASIACASFEEERAAIHKMAGCYLVDYSYTETESLKEGYVRDGRVYDVNKNKSFKELIYVIEDSPTKIRLQHVLFGVQLDGAIMEGSQLRHQAEDWEYAADFAYDFVRPANWVVRDLRSQRTAWLRKITNLDDGLRYQCSAPWNTENAYPEWTCSNYAPIPGRETRDMGRKDYNTLQRTTRIVNYGNSWLERQNNIKTIHDLATDVRTPLAKEEGKNWYVRLPDSECEVVVPYVKAHTPFWNLLQETWAGVLDGKSDFKEKVMQPNRYAKIMEMEDSYGTQDFNNAEVHARAKAQLMQIINDYRIQ